MLSDSHETIRITLARPLSGSERLGYEMTGHLELTPNPGVVDGPIHRIVEIGPDWIDVEKEPRASL